MKKLLCLALVSATLAEVSRHIRPGITTNSARSIRRSFTDKYSITATITTTGTTTTTTTGANKCTTGSSCSYRP